MKILNKIQCLLFGHKWIRLPPLFPKGKDGKWCERCLLEIDNRME